MRELSTSITNDTVVLFVTLAAPGFYVLTPCFDEAGAACDSSRIPVIAWALDGTGITWPVTVRTLIDQNADGPDPAILCPDGGVINFSKAWPSLADWLSEQKAS
jgi:hypothetical protein